MPFILSANSPQPKEFHFGVFAYQGIEKTTERYQPIADYLNETLLNYRVVLHVLPMEEIYRRISDQTLDFVTTNPSHFLVVRREFPLSGVIATLMPLAPDGQATQFLSGVIVTRAERADITTLQDLRGKRIATPSLQHMGGFRAQVYEMAMAGVPLREEQLLLTAVHQDAIRALLRGEVDVAFVRNGILETMAASGELKLNQLRLINPLEFPHFPMLSSTRLYPEWPVFALPHVDGEALRLFASALYSLEPDHPAAAAARIHGFTIPADYLVVEDLARTLRLPPFEDYGVITLRKVLQEYWLLVIAAVLLIVTLMALLLLSLASRCKSKQYAKNQARLADTLKKSDERYEQFFAQSLSGFFFMSADTPIDWANTEDKEALVDYALNHLRITKVNEAMLAQYGATQADFLGISPAKLFEFDPELGRKIIRELLKKGRLHAITLEKKIDGTPVTIEGNYVCTYDDKGRITGLFGIQNDITKSLESQERLLEFKTAVEQSVNGIVISDLDGNIKFVNQAWAKMHGYEAEELAGKHLSLFHTPEQMEEEVNPWIETLLKEGSKMGEINRLHKNGSVFPSYMTTSVLRNSDNKPFAMVVVTRDITEQVLAKAALEASEQRFKSILREVKSVSVQGYLMDGTVTYWNDASTRMYGYTAKEAIGQNLLDLIIPPELRDAVRQEIQTMRETGEPMAAAELTLKRKDGSPITVYSSHSLVEIPGKASEFFCIDIDLTERKQMENLMRDAMHKAEAANRAKSEFLANMSHEIRTPMNGVIGMSELLRDTPLNDGQQRYLDIICSSGEALLRIIDDILDISKMEAGKLALESRDFDLAVLVRDCTEALLPQAKAKGLQLSSAIDKGVPTQLYGDPGRLRQVLTNLLGNALKFTEQGKIHLAISVAGNRGDMVSLRFDVTDTGMGIPADKQALLFEKFSQVDSSSTRTHGGTGLGLAISKQLVEMMGGYITLASTPGEGSTFTFTALLQQASSS